MKGVYGTTASEVKSDIRQRHNYIFFDIRYNPEPVYFSEMMGNEFFYAKDVILYAEMANACKSIHPAICIPFPGPVPC